MCELFYKQKISLSESKLTCNKWFSPASYFSAANNCMSFVHPKSPELCLCVLEEQLKIQLNTW